MADTPIQFELKGIGYVTMRGVGPWVVKEHSPSSQSIFDSQNRPADPTVRSKLRPSSNVIFSRLDDAKAVVAKANELLLAEQAQF